MGALRRFAPAVVFALLPLIPLQRVVFSNHVIGPFDQIRQMQPWSDPSASGPWDVLQADAVLQFYPWRDLVFESWGKGQLPLWNPYQLAGTPLLANSQSAGFYPPHFVMGVLHVPTTAAMKLLAWFHLFWAGLGCYVLARRLGASEIGGYFCGSLFGLSAFMFAWIALPSVISTVAWIPWALALVAVIFEPLGRVARPIGQLALCIAMMVLAGHLQFAAYGLMAVGMLALWFWVAINSLPFRLRSVKLGAAISGVVLGLLMALPQLLPALEFNRRSHRQASPTEEGYAAYSASAIQPWELASVLGTSLVGLPRSWAPTEERLPSYWPEFIKRGANFAESAIGVGPVALVLLLLLPFRRIDWRKVGGVALIAAIGFLLATGTFFGRALYFFAPGWSSSGSPSRAEVLFVLGVSVLAGIVLSSKPRTESGGIRRYWPVVVPIAGIVLALEWPRFLPIVDGASGEALAGLASSVILQMLPGVVIASVAAIVVLGRWLGNANRDSEWAVCTIAAAGLILMHGTGIVPTSDVMIHPETSRSFERIAAINGPWEIVEAAPATLPPNTAGILRRYDLGGYDSLIDRETVELLRSINGEDPAPPANGNMMFIKANADPVRLAEAGISEVWSSKPLPQFGEPEQGPGSLTKYRLDGRRVSAESGHAMIVADGFDRQTVEAEGPGKLTVKDRNMPGWTASIEGRSIPIAPGLWRSVELPQGRHVVRFAYWPPGLAAGLYAGAVGWIGFAALLWLGRNRKFGTESAETAVK